MEKGQRKPSSYEARAIEAIDKWKNPSDSLLKKVWSTVMWPVNKTLELPTKVPGFNWVLQKSIGGLVTLFNDVAQRTVRPNAIYQEYRNNGFKEITSAEDIFKLDLKNVDKTIGFLAAKYKVLATAEGAATGAIGLPGIPPDIIALVTLNLRAIGEYATYCGFDVESQQERLFALNILGLASSPDDTAKSVAMVELTRLAREVAKKKTWEVLEKSTFVRIIRKITESLGRRLTKAKLAQSIPIIGAIIGGGFNAYYTSKVCDAAYYFYRERFLAEKYGSDIIGDDRKDS